MTAALNIAPREITEAEMMKIIAARTAAAKATTMPAAKAKAAEVQKVAEMEAAEAEVNEVMEVPEGQTTLSVIRTLLERVQVQLSRDHAAHLPLMAVLDHHLLNLEEEMQAYQDDAAKV